MTMTDHNLRRKLSIHEMKRLASLATTVAKKFLELRERCFDELGRDLYLASGTRSFIEQDRLYARGRTTPGKRVTNARAGFSWHNYGRAFDVALAINTNGTDLDWDIPQAMGELGEAIGLDWGGRWLSPVDENHFQFTADLSGSLAKARGALPNGFQG